MPTHRSSHAESQTPSTSRSSSRSSSNARNEIIAMLKEDHKQFKKAFRDFEKLDPEDDREHCETLVMQTCGQLQMHSKLEEELFYPTARKCLDDDDLVEEAEVEHLSIASLIDRLKDMSPDDEKYSATFKVLGEYVAHHVREEEGEIFPRLSHARFDWQDLQAEMNERRAELIEEFVPGSEAGEGEPTEGGSRRMAAARTSSQDSDEE